MNEDTKHPVVNLMEEQKNVTDKGVERKTWKCDIKPDSLAYNFTENRQFLNVTVIVMSTTVPMLFTKCRIESESDTGLVEIVNWRSSIFIGVQYHPEYKVPLQTLFFVNFVAAAVKAKK
jgi:CTP synthase